MSQTLIHIFAIETRPWLAIFCGIAIFGMTQQIFCTLYCPQECGLFTTLIAMLAFIIESQVISLLAQVSCNLVDTSGNAIAVFQAHILSPVELRMVKCLKTISLPLGQFSIFNRETFPFIMREVVLANAIDLLLTFSS